MGLCIYECMAISMHGLMDLCIIVYIDPCVYKCMSKCTLKIKDIIPDTVRRVRITRSSTQSHPF